jgi:hypothetical protein
LVVEEGYGKTPSHSSVGFGVTGDGLKVERARSHAKRSEYSLLGPFGKGRVRNVFDQELDDGIAGV